jgi:ferredoxin-NADP reductase
MFDVLSNSIPILGFALCALAMLQLAMWSAQSLSLQVQNKKQFELTRELLRQQIRDRTAPKSTSPIAEDGRWSGFRSFQLTRIVKETESCTSVYLTAEDGKPIALFQPGQHLALKLRIPGQSKPVVRCYSLSERPGLKHYRITVKSLKPLEEPAEPHRGASKFINSGLAVGGRVEVKAPSGQFVLDESSSLPIVMLAGGIGITPMVSMVNHLVEMQSDRQILLMYGVRNSAEHAFKQHFESLAAKHANLFVINCYSRPRPEEIKGQDYQVRGHVTVELLKKLLPKNDCQFYLCGPTSFMQALHGGLTKWEVPISRIHYESFGPATIQKPTLGSPGKSGNSIAKAAITFAKSRVNANWDPSCESLLNLAEERGVEIESGCRAGSCGTCATTILKGSVDYPDPQAVDCDPSQCLVCIAKPKGPLKLDA